MKIKHKVQRKLDPTFQAELKLCSLCRPTTWWHWVVCAGSRDGPWRWFLGAHLPGRCNCGVRGRVGVSASGLQWAALCCSLSLHCFSQNPAFTLPASELLLVLFFFLRLFCPRLRIRETTEKPTPMQTHEGLFTSSSLCPSTPDIAEQGLGPRGGF